MDELKGDEELQLLIGRPKLTQLSLRASNVNPPALESAFHNLTDLNIALQKPHLCPVSVLENIPNLRSLKWKFSGQFTSTGAAVKLPKSLTSLTLPSEKEWILLVQDQVENLPWVRQLQILIIDSVLSALQEKYLPSEGFTEMRVLRLQFGLLLPLTWCDKLARMKNLRSFTFSAPSNLKVYPPNLVKLMVTVHNSALSTQSLPASLTILKVANYDKASILEKEKILLEFPNLPNLRELTLRNCNLNLEEEKCRKLQILSLDSVTFPLSKVPSSVHTFSAANQYSFEELSKLPHSVVNLTIMTSNPVPLLRFTLSRFGTLRTVRSPSVNLYFGKLTFDTKTEKYGGIRKGKTEIEKFLSQVPEKEYLEQAQKEKEIGDLLNMSERMRYLTE